jgi:hypothetical protein
MFFSAIGTQKYNKAFKNSSPGPGFPVICFYPAVVELLMDLRLLDLKLGASLELRQTKHRNETKNQN